MCCPARICLGLNCEFHLYNKSRKSSALSLLTKLVRVQRPIQWFNSSFNQQIWVSGSIFITFSWLLYCFQISHKLWKIIKGKNISKIWNALIGPQKTSDCLNSTALFKPRWYKPSHTCLSLPRCSYFRNSKASSDSSNFPSFFSFPWDNPHMGSYKFSSNSIEFALK